MKKVIFIFLYLSLNYISAQDYFQQETNYIIDVSLNDVEHSLSGFEKIEYINHSEDTLSFIWIHLWPNAYKNKNTALSRQKIENGDDKLYYSSNEEQGYIDSLEFKVDGKPVKWNYHEKNIDICKITLNSSLKPNEKVTISTPFFVKIPDGQFSRLGHVDQSYMITQWYPKPAVYDKDGWHIMPYLDQGEFYSEFGTFEVRITIPENYIVGATGDLQNKEEIDFLNNKAANGISNFNTALLFPESSEKTKTLYYKQKNIHDFAWFADKRFHVLKGEVELPYSKRKVTIWTMFTNNEAELWENSIEYMHDAIYYYSLWNGEYPYKQCTAVDGTISAGGGMEYPNVTIIGESGTAKALEEVIVHEVGHNWFYGIIGTNERKHPWMDEGINSYYEHRYMQNKYPEHNILFESIPDFIKKILNINNYKTSETYRQLININAHREKDQPIELSSEKYIVDNYWGIVYTKASLVFRYLASYLGQELFDKCMQEYFKSWKFKHPTPEDLKLIFEKHTDKNLDWFFYDLIQTTKKIDYTIKDIKDNQDDFIITIKNKGEIASPLSISGIKDQSIQNTIWIEGFTDTKKINYKNLDYDFIQIDANHKMYEIKNNNNIIKTKGLFKKIKPLRFQFLGSLYDQTKTQIFYHPNIKLNYYDKTIIGIKFYNQFLPNSGLIFKANPMYSTGLKTLSGNAEILYKHYTRNSFIKKIETGISISKFGYETDLTYKKIEPFINYYFNKKNPRGLFDFSSKNSLIILEKEIEKINLFTSSWSLKNKNLITPYTLNITGEFSKEFKKISFQVNYKYRVNQKRKITARYYLGIVNSNNHIYDIQMSAWNGSKDYGFFHNFIGRSETDGFLSQQIKNREGGIKHITNLSSESYLSSINLEYSLSNFLNIYIEGGTNGHEIAYGSGLHLTITDGLNIYLPIYTESGLSDFKALKTLRYNINLKVNFNLFSD